MVRVWLWDRVQFRDSVGVRLKLWLGLDLGFRVEVRV